MSDTTPKVYTIPSGGHFLKKLATGVMELAEGDIKRLTGIRVLLPTRRAARGLRDAFVDLRAGQPLLLPRLQPLGDVDNDELDLTLSGLGLDLTDIPPAISALERQFLLSSFVRAKDPDIPLSQSLVLAKALATLLDQVHTEGLDFGRLPDLVPQGDFAAHWQETLRFLDIVTSTWPAVLAERGQIDPSHRRALLMEALTQLWRDHPPATPVIAAGSTGSIPATARLLSTIAHMPQGSVILPGLDLAMDQESWDVIDDTHPQRTMKNLLATIGIDRAEVRLWPACREEEANTPRHRLIREMMRPAETFGRTTLSGDSIAEFAGSVSICEAANAREQASLIATAIRKAIEDPQKTVCLVTPDRALARRVTIALKRWGIEADDSAGCALSATESGKFLLLLFGAIEKKISPVPLLGLLRHPLFARTEETSPEIIDAFERHVLRGPRPASGFEGLGRRIAALDDPDQRTAQANFLAHLESMMGTAAALAEGNHRPADMLWHILATAETIAGGKENFWAQEESDSLSNLMTRLLIEAENLPTMGITTLADIVRTLLQQESLREVQPRHPRIVILGQLESRLIQHDVMILAGLNEGLWPAEPAHDPWMSRPMRRKFGLPPAARSIGLSAHDFAEGLCAREVIITRTVKEEGAETVPSRWLQRLSTLLRAVPEGLDRIQGPGATLLAWTQSLDAPRHAYRKPERPSPVPPLAARPQNLSVTWIEKWMKNPYHVYAAKILKLRRIDPLEDESVAAERGTFIHAILEEFAHGVTPQETAEDARARFMAIAESRLAEMETLSPQWHYWWPRMEGIAAWVVATEQAWRKEAAPWKTECEGRLTIYENTETGRRFTLTARADRIDRIRSGGATIIDYKTGNPPAKKSVRSGQSPQLPLEGLILEKGGFEDSPLTCAGLDYWKISLDGQIVSLAKSKDFSLTDLLRGAEEGIATLVRQYEDPSTPYIPFPPTGSRIYEDERAYAHLARTAEWSVVGGGDEASDEAPENGEGDA